MEFNLALFQFLCWEILIQTCVQIITTKSMFCPFCWCPLYSSLCLNLRISKTVYTNCMSMVQRLQLIRNLCHWGRRKSCYDLLTRLVTSPEWFSTSMRWVLKKSCHGSTSGSTVVEQSTHNPKIKGLSPTTTDREWCLGSNKSILGTKPNKPARNLIMQMWQFTLQNTFLQP